MLDVGHFHKILILIMENIIIWTMPNAFIYIMAINENIICNYYPNNVKNYISQKMLDVGHFDKI